jgi:hypothetical protein
MTKIVSLTEIPAADDLVSKVDGRFATILADPPWQFQNRTGKMAPEHKRLLRYPTMEMQEILDLPVDEAANDELAVGAGTGVGGGGEDTVGLGRSTNGGGVLGSLVGLRDRKSVV